MAGLVGHVLNSIVDIVGDAAMMWMIKDHQPGQEDRVLQPMHRQAHEVVAFSLVVQNQGEEGCHQHKDNRAANYSIGDAGIIEQLVL